MKKIRTCFRREIPISKGKISYSLYEKTWKSAFFYLLHLGIVQFSLLQSRGIVPSDFLVQKPVLTNRRIQTRKRGIFAIFYNNSKILSFCSIHSGVHNEKTLLYFYHFFDLHFLWMR